MDDLRDQIFPALIQYGIPQMIFSHYTEYTIYNLRKQLEDCVIPGLSVSFLLTHLCCAANENTRGIWMPAADFPPLFLFLFLRFLFLFSSYSPNIQSLYHKALFESLFLYYLGEKVLLSSHSR